ncbi:MAG TPA: aspartate aminotransferase family protein, partial [Aestuariivirgaceae bacterium]|nr:aspartate aminotransferase family protein [Aestuariivirgaceae bacterium]
PFTDHKTLHAGGGARIITQAQGAWIWDGNGEKLFDAMSGLWCVNIGYGRKELAEAAYRQMLELPYYNTFFKTSTVPATELAAKVASLLPDHLNSVFFVNSGSEANDTIVRLLRHYWALKGQPDRQIFIGRHRAYHGSTMASASLGGMPAMHGQGGLPLPGFEHVLQPDWYGQGGDMSPDEFGLHAARQIEAKIREVGPQRIAGVIGEPIQGAGGVIIPPATYWPEVERICRAHGIPLIADEVICGFGRTGNWWGFETFGFTPDIVPMAKGLSSGYLPIGAVAVSDAIMKDFIELGGEFFHGYTYSGHPAACAVALENIRIIEDERLVERVRDLAPVLNDKLAALADHPLVGEVRSCGFIGAVELVRDKKTRARFEPEGRVGIIARELCVANGLIMRACWDTLVFAPPFSISEADMDEWVIRLGRALDATLADVSHEMA